MVLLYMFCLLRTSIKPDITSSLGELIESFVWNCKVSNNLQYVCVLPCKCMSLKNSPGGSVFMF